MLAVYARIKNAYIHFLEKQGFSIIVTLCVAVITAAAVWTSHQEENMVSPTPPAVEHVSAAQLIQESLKNIATPTSMPTATPKVWHSPVDQINILQPFSTTTMVKSAVSDIWSFHDAVDLKANAGNQIYAMSNGVILTTGTDQLNGTWFHIDHGDGIQAFYAGMIMGSAYLPGDEIRAGDTLGFAGNCLLEEHGLGPHLHLRVTKDGLAIDPLTLLDTTH